MTEADDIQLVLKDLDVGSTSLPTDRAPVHAHTTHLVTGALLSHGPRVWNNLPAHLHNEDISYNSFIFHFHLSFNKITDKTLLHNE